MKLLLVCFALFGSTFGCLSPPAPPPVVVIPTEFSIWIEITNLFTFSANSGQRCSLGCLIPQQVWENIIETELQFMSGGGVGNSFQTLVLSEEAEMLINAEAPPAGDQWLALAGDILEDIEVGVEVRIRICITLEIVVDFAIVNLLLESLNGPTTLFFGEINDGAFVPDHFDVLGPSTLTVQANGNGDPHLTGFHGEKLDITHDFPAEHGLSFYCDREIHLFGELASTPEGAVYIVRLLARFGSGDVFEFGIHGFDFNTTHTTEAHPHGIIYHFPDVQVFVEENNKKVSAQFGSGLKVQAVINVEDMFEFVDMTLSAPLHHLSQELTGGVLGRTLARNYNDDEFRQYSQFTFPVKDIERGAFIPCVLE